MKETLKDDVPHVKIENHLRSSHIINKGFSNHRSPLIGRWLMKYYESTLSLASIGWGGHSPTPFELDVDHWSFQARAGLVGKVLKRSHI